MSLIRKGLPLAVGLVLTISVATAVNKEKAKFSPPELDTLITKDSHEGLTIGAVPYVGEELAKAAFGKVHPYEHGVLPVLLVIRNGGNSVVKLDTWKVEYIDRNKETVNETPATELPYLQAPRRPSMSPSPIPGIPIGRGRKNPLGAEELQTRAFAAKILPPGESAHGFLYFRTRHHSGAKLYVNGLKSANTGKDLFYFEIPLD
ncbi:MAG TPA: hypothetical protein VEQ63_11530 [Bryobacteraceae bacterium]|nr:hypothetical protein [Bryobacteraceae bacterium]